MASDQLLNNSFAWGDEIYVSQEAPNEFHPGTFGSTGTFGSICGIREISSLQMAKKFDQKMGSKIYLVEFENGEAIEIPEMYLTKYIS